MKNQKNGQHQLSSSVLSTVPGFLSHRLGSAVSVCEHEHELMMMMMREREKREKREFQCLLRD